MRYLDGKGPGRKSVDEKILTRKILTEK